jgi:hypothetical protein
MSHHEKPDEQHDDDALPNAEPGSEEHTNDGSTAHPNTEVTAEDEQDTVSGGAPERP